MIISNDIGVDPNSLASFWHKITRNTNYIIHPDELAADNYVYVIYWKSTPDQTIDRFSKNGQQLLEEIFREMANFEALTIRRLFAKGKRSSQKKCITNDVMGVPSSKRIISIVHNE